jgi:hypothetical protein
MMVLLFSQDRKKKQDISFFSQKGQEANDKPAIGRLSDRN